MTWVKKNWILSPHTFNSEMVLSMFWFVKIYTNTNDTKYTGSDQLNKIYNMCITIYNGK